MAIILNINTAFETASVILSNNSEIMLESQSGSQKEHASFIEPAIQSLCKTSGTNLNHIDAIAVVNGPGSYTGLRVGLSSAKALCYALNKPLILLNTLDVMAYALKQQSPGENENTIFCPLIDARRMEVYTAFYDYQLNRISDYSAEILDESFLESLGKFDFTVAGGSGSLKLQKITHSKNIFYINKLILSGPFVNLAYQAFLQRTFSNVVYSEPFYLKPVYFRNNNL